MSTNIERLGDTLSQRMKRSAIAAVPTTLELGIINGNLSLSVDSIGTPIPQGDYMVDLRLTHENYYSYNELNSSAKAPTITRAGPMLSMRATATIPMTMVSTTTGPRRFSAGWSREIGSLWLGWEMSR